MRRRLLSTAQFDSLWHGGKFGLATFAILIPLTLARPGSAQTDNPVQAATVSAASFGTPVAPDSLVSIFGTRLSTRVVQAQLDARGQLPMELDGTTVEINGRPAPLIFVSPDQINCVVPADTDVGAASVVVRARSAGFISRGTVPVRTVAPALFSLDASGAGRGAILNAVTFRLDPFAIETPENPGSDRRTRLAVFATGLRLAGNPQRDPSVTNVAPSVRAEARDATGRLWPLAVEYAGAAPGFFGLDQVNVVLPPEADATGVVVLTVIAESSPSNSVTLTVRSLAAPRVFSFSPASSPPGGELTISGNGFVPETVSTSGRRNYVVFDVGSGLEVPVVPVAASGNSLRVFVPPIPVGAQDQWYEGPLQVCVVVDGQRSCHGQPLMVEAAVRPSGSPGETLLGVGRQLLQASVAGLNEGGQGVFAQAVQTAGQRDLNELQAMLQDAVAGRPRSITFENIDGATETVVFDLATLQRLESLLAANQAAASSTLSKLKELGLVGQQGDAAPVQCALSEERTLEGLKDQHELVMAAQQVLVWASMATTVTIAVKACLATAPTGFLGCVPAATLAIKGTLPVVGSAYTLASWGLYARQILIEYGTNLLESISVNRPPIQAIEVAPAASAEIQVWGKFVPISTETALNRIAESVVVDVFFQAFPVGEPPVVQDVLLRILKVVAKIVFERWRDGRALPPLAGSRSVQVELGRRSITAEPPDRPEASVSLACGDSDRSRVLGKATTGGRHVSFFLTANTKNLLLWNRDGPPPQTVLGVAVGTAATPAITTDRQTYRVGEVVTVSGANFPGRAFIRTTWTDPQSRQQVFESQSDAQGTFRFSVPLSSTAPTGTYRLVAAVVGANLTATGQFSVTSAPVVSLASVSVSPGTTVGGSPVTGTVTLTGAAAAGGAVVAVRSSHPAARVPAGVTVPQGQTSATFAVTTDAVDSTQTVTITATFGGLSRAATLIINPRQSPSIAYVISTFVQDISGLGFSLDSLGNLYVAAGTSVRKITPDGMATIVAGDRFFGGFRGDGGPATSARLNGAAGVAVDEAGNIYIADAGNQRIRRVTPDGLINTVAGKGFESFSGDGGPATGAALDSPGGVAVDTMGNLYIADTDNHRIRKVTADGLISTVAGSGPTGPPGGGFGGDGGPATSARLNGPTSLVVDTAGNLYVADTGNHTIRKATPAGIINSVAGAGVRGFNGDGGPATWAALNGPSGLAIDTGGSLYIADTGNQRVRQVTSSGIINTIAGNGLAGFGGDAGPARSAQLSAPRGLAVDAAGNVYVSHSSGLDRPRIRKLSPTSVPIQPGSYLISTVAGGGGGGGLAAPFYQPSGVAIDRVSNLYVASSASIVKVTPGGVISELAVTFTTPDSLWSGPPGVTVDGAGNLYFSDPNMHKIQRITPVGAISTVAGTGEPGFEPGHGDGGPATSATLFEPSGIAVDALGSLYIADQSSSRIRRVTPTGIIATAAGTVVMFGETAGFSGDGGRATAALLARPVGVAVDGTGNLYIADTGNHRIRRVTPAGLISTIAGSGPSWPSPGGFGGDGGPATAARLDRPEGVAVDAAGNIYIADSGNHRIRKVTPAGIITTIGGGGAEQGSSIGDGGPGTEANLKFPVGLAIDGTGSLFVADSGNGRIRKLTPR